MNGDPKQRMAIARRDVLRFAVALLASPAARALSLDPHELPGVRALVEYLGGRVPQFGRLKLELPRIADNGKVVPMKLAMAGPFESGRGVRAIRLFSEKNPVPLIASFEFPVAPPRVEIESRIRLAASQRVAALAELEDATLCAAVADVEVTITGCIDGT
jgi:sulfur-oxidizing protein SoxY